jgi:hypothetical protein
MAADAADRDREGHRASDESERSEASQDPLQAWGGSRQGGDQPTRSGLLSGAGNDDTVVSGELAALRWWRRGGSARLAPAIAGHVVPGLQAAGLIDRRSRGKSRVVPRLSRAAGAADDRV